MKQLFNFSVGLCLVFGSMTSAVAGTPASFLCLRGGLYSTHTNVNGSFDDRHGDSRRSIQFGTQEQCVTAVSYSNSGFICHGKRLISAGRGSLSDAASEQACWTAVARAKNGFACLGDALYNAENGYIAVTEGTQDCLNSVNSSK